MLESWMVDPDSRRVPIFRHNGSEFDPAVELSAEAGDVLTTPLLPGLEIRVGEIFE